MKHGIDRSDLERIAEALSNATVPVDKEVSKFEAIARLSNVIARMRKRGHSLDSVVSFLQAQQVPISVGTLKTYLHRLKKQRAIVGRKAPKHERQQRVNRPAPATPTSTVTTAVTRAEGSANGSVIGRQVDPLKARFVPREDTEEI